MLLLLHWSYFLQSLAFAYRGLLYSLLRVTSLILVLSLCLAFGNFCQAGHMAKPPLTRDRPGMWQSHL
ncbi:uncharacterized protein M421DRAFT_415869 [Didymella exigua CBS 183.55]|uniref:Uncharacterized protein n=1 Tax=Didymella exigua CBS 183.55 TaxID=1150837 RepID=A0A6A5S166_9PLEO|nr:uncharacterized protein M421DRAFT_415869 [Didymella exigua CBS 183.55]KAF1933529.1 hypothetical protein M421DRAFT_415869 [Didymella exigua CBS 183.55]